jgi:hypothetical protein
MNNDIEPVLAGLLTHLENSVVVNFTGDGVSGSPTISNVSNFTGLFTGLPTFGSGVTDQSVIDTVDVGARTITLDQPLGDDAVTGASFTTGFLTTGRRTILWTQVASQPALFLRHTATEDDWNNIVFSRVTVEAEIWIYSRAGADPDAPADTSLNNLVRAVRESFAPDNHGTNTFTLGGLVYWCRIEGKSDYDPGDIDGQSKAVLPVRLMLP